MTRQLLNSSVLSLALLLAAQHLSRAGTTDTDLAKSFVLEKDVAYLRVIKVEKNLADQIQSAQNSLAATNAIIGTVLDLRFADGGDSSSAKAAAGLFAAKNMPLAILVNGETHGEAVALAGMMNEKHEGLIFGGTTGGTKSWGPVQPDIPVPVKTEDEKKFFENPYGTPAQGEAGSAIATNNFTSFVDHTTEADLVRAKIKDGEQDEKLRPERASEPPRPIIRDPVLARAVDLIKGIAAARQSRS